MGNQVSVSDLVVMDFRSTELTKDIEKWKFKSKVPFAESCARQIWYGHKDDFESFPYDPENESFARLEGAEAYAYLLKFTLGFNSRKVGETDIRGQFFNGWSQMNKKYPEEAKRYDQLVQHITADTRLIKELYCQDFKHPRYELAVRDMVGMEETDKILIIGHLDRNQKITSLTDGMARVTGSHARKVKSITFTHPEPEALKAIKEQVEDLYIEGKVKSDVQFEEFENLSNAIEQSDKVYVCSPMNENAEADEFITQAWESRVRGDNTLICLKGDVANSGLSSDLWKSKCLTNYVSPEGARASLAERMKNNEKIAERVEKAAIVCANIRAENRRPSFKMFKSHKIEDLAAEFL